METYNTCARDVASLTVLPKGWRCISINEEHEEYYPLRFEKGNEHKILRVRFSDVTAPIQKFAHDNKVFNPIDGTTSKTIVDFIEENKNKNFLVHCAAGVSRSAAVCLYIHKEYGHKLKSRFWQLSQPNAFVLGRLMKLKLYINHLEIEGRKMEDSIHI